MIMYRHCRRNHNGKKTGSDRGNLRRCSKTISYRNAERKEKLSYCGEMPGQDAQNKTLVRVYERYFLYPNIVATVTVFFEELEEKKTSITYMLSSYEFGLLGIDFGVSGSMTREVEKRIEAVRLLEA